jgi:hypothetical protein
VRLERTVERAMEVGIEVAGKLGGPALVAIRDEYLYRRTHSNFGDYVKERFGLGRRTAYRMMETPKPRPIEERTGPKPSSRCDTVSQPVEGSGGDRAETTDDTPGPGHPVMPEAGERLWAEVVEVTVVVGRGGVLRLVAEADNYPPVGAGVLVTWTP